MIIIRSAGLAHDRCHHDCWSERTYHPKGIDELALDKVMTVLNRTYEGLTSKQAGHIVERSRTTSRRYLEYLVSLSEASNVSYGIVGRPEHVYQNLSKSNI